MFQGLKEDKSKTVDSRTVYQNLDDLTNLAMYLAVKVRAEKAWLPTK